MTENSEDDNPIWPTVIFIVLNLLFISLMFVGLTRFSSGAAAYEEAYSKKIALLLDYSKPGMELQLKMTKPLEICKKNNCDIPGMIKIKDGKVVVTLSSTRGYAYYTFKDYTYDISHKEDVWTIKIKDE